jgi:hypothetical protein
MKTNPHADYLRKKLSQGQTETFRNILAELSDSELLRMEKEHHAKRLEFLTPKVEAVEVLPFKKLIDKALGMQMPKETERKRWLRKT